MISREWPRAEPISAAVPGIYEHLNNLECYSCTPYSTGDMLSGGRKACCIVGPWKVTSRAHWSRAPRPFMEGDTRCSFACDRWSRDDRKGILLIEHTDKHVYGV